METITSEPINEEKSKSVWWVILIVIVLLIAAFIAFFWRSIPYSSVIDFSIFKKDDVSSIEKDLGSVETDNLDSELADIEKIINQ